MYARREGLEATIIERQCPPIDKPCGEGLMPDGVELLRALGVSIPTGQRAPITGIRYLDGERIAEARFPGRSGWGVRRTVLQAAMARRAEETGVRLLWGRSDTGLRERGVETDQGAIDARWIVEADGLHSRVSAWAGIGVKVGRHRRFGVRRHFARAPWSDRVEVHWANGCEAYVTPVAADSVGVAMLWGDGKSDFDRLLARLPALGERLAGADVISSDLGTGPLWQRPVRLRAGRVVLVGDAAGYIDAITGEGLSLGLQQARVLAAAIARDDLAAYEREARRLAALPFALIRLLLLAERHPVLRRRLIATLARDPALFARLLAIHTRQAPPRELGVGGALRLLRGLVLEG